MAVETGVSVEEYLSTDYEPDCDYVDGVLEGRNLGEWDHSRLQTLIASYFVARSRALGIRVVVEQRVQVGPTRFRIPDITVVERNSAEKIIRTAPLLCIEILSPEDRLQRVAQRSAEYVAMGVPDVWIIDPAALNAYTYTSKGLHQISGHVLRSQDGRIEVDLDQVIKLDEV
jgi:Uma2 family endonuclease